MAFATSLFLSVLADHVCYTSFKSNYERFRALTQYPKWRGDCPGACHYHVHPAAVFRDIGSPEGRLGELGELPYGAFPDDLFSVMKREVITFVDQQVSPVAAEAFWGRRDGEIPLEFRLWYMASRSDR